MTMLDPRPTAPGSTRKSVSLLLPRTLDEALEMLAQPDTAALGGGVGHLLRHHDRGPTADAALVAVGSLHPDRGPAAAADAAPVAVGPLHQDRGPTADSAAALVAVGPLPELGGIEWSAGHVSIGAGVRLARIEADARLARIWPLVTEAAGSVATARIRRLVTLGGNIGACDDSHDPPVALAAAGATLTLCGRGSTRTVPASNISGLTLRPGEIIRDVRLPVPAGRVGSAFEKFLVRGVWEYACVNVAAVVRLGEDGTARELSLAVGSVTGGPVLVDLVDLRDERVQDAAFTPAVLDEIGRRAAAVTEPYSDVRGSARYKSRMIAEFARRAVTRALHRAAAKTEGSEGTGEDR